MAAHCLHHGVSHFLKQNRVCVLTLKYVLEPTARPVQSLGGVQSVGGARLSQCSGTSFFSPLDFHTCCSHQLDALPPVFCLANSWAPFTFQHKHQTFLVQLPLPVQNQFLPITKNPSLVRAPVSPTGSRPQQARIAPACSPCCVFPLAQCLAQRLACCPRSMDICFDACTDAPP